MNLWGPIAATDCLTSTLVGIECDAVCTKFKQILVLAFINTVCYMTPGVSNLKYYSIYGQSLTIICKTIMIGGGHLLEIHLGAMLLVVPCTVGS